MGKKSRSKSGPSKSTSLVLAADPAPSEKKRTKKNNRVPPVQEKDAEEEFLEKLIFGDAEGFEAGLNELDGGGYSDDSDGEEGGGGGGGGIALAGDGDVDAGGADLQALQDDELFFVDEGPSGTDVIPARVSGGEEGEVEEEDDDLPAWQDSDDEMLTISLANRGLLRKLRDTESEDLISGKEYSARLRRQFERIYPVPEWAAAGGGSDRRRRKRVGLDGSSSDEEMGGVEEGGDEEAVRSAPSLEEILRSTTTNWTRKVPGRLRPEKLTIVRLADGNRIGGSLVYTYTPFPSRHQSINKYIQLVNDINPPLPPPPPPPPLLRTRLNPPPSPHKRHHKPPRHIPPPPQHPHLNRSLPPLRHKHNRLRPAKILPHLEPLHRHHPESNQNIRPRRGTKVNGDLPHLPGREIHGPSR